jgi:hypothetical protein
VVAGDDGSGAAPGRLLPDTGDVEPVDGDPRPLHELTHRRGHTLIVLGGPQADPGQVGDLVAELEGLSGAAVDAVGVAGVTVLGVRPDRYIGLRDDSGDPRVVAAYLNALAS